MGNYTKTNHMTKPMNTPPQKIFQLNYQKTNAHPIDLNCLETQFEELKNKKWEEDPPSEPSEEKMDYNPFRTNHLQQYNPTYLLFFQLNKNNFNNVSFNHKYYIKNMFEVIDVKTNETIKQNVFVKCSPLLDPIRYMTGKYDVYGEKIRVLPTVESDESVCIDKILKHTNASYIDNFFCFLSSVLVNEHDIVHGINYFGSFLGIQEKFKMNVEDDIEYLANYTYFKENVGKRFCIENEQFLNNGFFNYGSKNNKQKLKIMENDANDEEPALVLECDVLETNFGEKNDTMGETNVEMVYANENDDVKRETVVEDENDDDDSDSNDSDSSGEDSGVSDDDEDGGSEEDDDSSEEEWEDESEGSCDDNDVFAYINNFPIQMICLEKCDGTLDELFEQELMNDENGFSMLFQIIMTLLMYQKCFDFTHNDLHTNNIMYVKTDVKYLFYFYDNTYYRVPTFGRIFKIIDFGRAIYKYNGLMFCSDSFSSGGDASTQYNCEPFYNKKKPRIEPNYSFDLCRLACSIYDFIMVDNDMNENKMNSFQKLIHDWCLDDQGKNILYKKNGDERYPNFKLYKMIARNVHNKEPKEQIKLDVFQQYVFSNNHKNAKKIKHSTIPLLNVDALPIYTKNKMT